MCRWLVYYGDELCAHSLVYETKHSLTKQSEGMEERMQGSQYYHNSNDGYEAVRRAQFRLNSVELALSIGRQLCALFLPP